MQLRKKSFDDDRQTNLSRNHVSNDAMFHRFHSFSNFPYDTRSNILRSHIDSQSSAFVNSSRHGASSMREYNLKLIQ